MAGSRHPGAISGTQEAAHALSTDPPAPGLQYLFRVQAQVGPPLEAGTVDGLTRRMIPILGGQVSGPKLNGHILPGGADWQLIRADGTAEIYARYLIQSTCGAIIEVENPGVRSGPPEIMWRLQAGEAVDPALYYFRTTPRFRSSAPEYGFLTRTVCICTAVRTPAAVLLNVFGLL